MKLQILPVFNKIIMSGLVLPQQKTFGSRTAYDQDCFRVNRRAIKKILF